MAERLHFDVLVVGSGASGLAAAVSAERAGARVGLVTKGALQSCNSAKAQGGIQAAFGDDDSPQQHAEDVWQSSHETANRELVDVLTGEAPSAIHWLEEHGVEFTRENGGYRLARCGGSSRKRLLQVGDRTGHAITTALRDAFQASSGEAIPNCPLVFLERTENGWLATCRPKSGGELQIEAGAVVLAAGGRCYREAEERRELSTNHPGATGEVTQIALELGAESRDLDALQYHPNGGAWPPTMQGYSIPETTRAYGATLLNADGEESTDPLGPRDAVSQAIFVKLAGAREQPLRRGWHERRGNRSAPGCRGCGRVPLRLGTEGHPAGFARRPRRGEGPRDLDAGQARARDDRPQRRGRGRPGEPRLPGHWDRRLHVPGWRELPAPPGSDLRGAQARHRARDAGAPAALERRPHAHAREHRPEHRLPAPDRALGVHSRVGRAGRQVRSEGLRLGEHELPEDVRPRRRREGDQAVRPRVDRRRGREALSARDRRRRHRRLGRLRDVPRQGGDRAARRHAQSRSARGP